MKNESNHFLIHTNFLTWEKFNETSLPEKEYFTVSEIRKIILQIIILITRKQKEFVKILK